MTKRRNKGTGRGRAASGPSMNPKDLAALDRVPLWSLPAIGAIHGAQGTANGIEKYGSYNWRELPIKLMEYLGAMERHIACLKDGEDVAQDSGVTHLGHIIATASIILDAQQCGTLIDDRPALPGRSAATMEEYKNGRNAAKAAKRRTRKKRDATHAVRKRGSGR